MKHGQPKVKKLLFSKGRTNAG